MLEVTPQDIADLDDEALRTLVGLLCEAELRTSGQSAAFATWGGDQNAGDGGLDVRVSLPAGTLVTGFLPRASTGFQVKKPNISSYKIIKEMCPSGVLRPVLAAIAAQSGAYIIVSSGSNLSDSMLSDRRKAMAEAVSGLDYKDSILLDFYDRGRIATWVRQHPGLILWVKREIGRAITGWQPYGAWAYTSEGVDAEYIVDDRLRVRSGGKRGDEDGVPALEGIGRIRCLLRQHKHVVRLVGLSGVGKTRLVQALFDNRVGEESLNPSLAFYTNVADDPDPPPSGFAAQLIALRTRGILIVDNCPPSLHQRLAEVCRSQGSLLSVITTEYDIRDDEPEGTEVCFLEPSSVELIKILVSRRYPTISDVNAETVANASGGNARIAIALAGSIGKGETIAGLTDWELFRRLFQQKNDPDESLLLAAQVLALVYSFDGEDVSYSENAELARLGAMIGKKSAELYRSVAELLRRDLAQKRGVWRAVLPHAIANYLAASALEILPSAVIQQQLVTTARLFRSFTRRLGYLHHSKEAVALVNGWLGQGGLLGNVGRSDELINTVFENIAPVSPDATLMAIERALLDSGDGERVVGCIPYIHVIRKIAYEPRYFERCVAVLVKIASNERKPSSEAAALVESLFPLYLSGTLASIEQRVKTSQHLIESQDPFVREIGFKTLRALLKSGHFSSGPSAEFGARSRDHGYRPRSQADVKHWFSNAILLAVKIAICNENYNINARLTLADSFTGLWIRGEMYAELEQACQSISQHGFWREGWIAVRQTLRFHGKNLSPEDSESLSRLDELLRPKNLVQKVRAIVLTSGHIDIEFDEPQHSGLANRREGMLPVDSVAVSLGMDVAGTPEVLDDLLPDLLGGVSTRLWLFGRGLQEGATDAKATWERMLAHIGSSPGELRTPFLLRGYLYGLGQNNASLANDLLDDAVNNPLLASWFPVLQAAVAIDSLAVNRLRRSLALGSSPIRMYDDLAMGRTCEYTDATEMRDLLLDIASKPDGGAIALNILHMRLFSDRERKREFAPEIIEAGCDLLKQITVDYGSGGDGYLMGEVARLCLTGARGALLAEELCREQYNHEGGFGDFTFDHHHLLEGLLTVQPRATLNGLCGGNQEERDRATHFIQVISDGRKSPLDVVSESVILEWCDASPEIRYPMIAAIIKPFTTIGDLVPLEWTALALSLLDKAPDRIHVLRHYTQRLRPMSWKGSRAAAMEANVKLLDDLTAFPDPNVVSFINEDMRQLRGEAEAARIAETAWDCAADERFE